MSLNMVIKKIFRLVIKQIGCAECMDVLLAFHERNFMGYVGGGSNRFLEADDIQGFTEV